MSIIGSFTFERTRLKKISIPSSVQSIGDHAFCNCPLSEFDVNKDNKVYFSKDGILYKRVNGEENILIKYPPQKCGSSFSVDEGTRMLGSCAFTLAAELLEIQLHNNIYSIGEQHPFACCTSLKKMALPSLVKKIPQEAFANCISLEEIFLPNSDHYTIEDNVFSGCSSLIKIHCEANNPDGIMTSEKAFDDFKIDECTLFIPAGTRWAYRHHPGFGKFKKNRNRKESIIFEGFFHSRIAFWIKILLLEYFGAI